MAMLMMMSHGVDIEMTIDVDLSWLLDPRFRHLASEELLQIIEDGNDLSAWENKHLWQPYFEALQEDIDQRIMGLADGMPKL